MRTLHLLFVSLASFMAIQQCKAAKPRDRAMTIHAEVTCADGDPGGSYALLFISGKLADSTSTSDEGGFTVDLPLDVEAVLEVHKPGCVAKRIEVDTHHAKAGKPVRCEIMLFPQPEGEELDYSAPVGRFSFNPGTGELNVSHDYRMGNARLTTIGDARIASGS